ncbi:radical SAM protein [Candidatus Woesearchaeota archaeon]|nr:radical SAM protein [Candidatus Woesearchaeota archaeon]
MKISLLYPGFENWVTPPLGLVYLATFLKEKGFDVSLKDYSKRKISSLEVIKDIEGSNLVGVYAGTNSSIFRSIKISKIAKKQGLPVCWGGPHPTELPEIAIKNDFVDYVIPGEGELPFLSLCNFIAKKIPKKNLQGVIYKEKGLIIKTPSLDFLDLDTLPVPDWNLLDDSCLDEDLLTYSNPLIETSRGCNYNCFFCRRPISFGKKLRYKSIQRVIIELKNLKKRFPNLKRIFIIDNTFTANKSRTIKLLKAIRKEDLNFSYTCDTRVDCVDEEIIHELKLTGFEWINFGVESGSPKILKLMKKGISPSQIKKAFYLCRNVGIKTFAFILLDNPSETYKDLLQTIILLLKIRANYYRISFLKPFSGTELFDLTKKYGFTKPESLNDYIYKIYDEDKLTFNFSKIHPFVLILTRKLFDTYNLIKNEGIKKTIIYVIKKFI